jgi:radical SAM protein with 4Fe4S-binding SPASM domain
LDDLTLEITKKCPLSCILCSSDGGDPYLNEFSLCELKDIVDQAKSLGVTQISLSGGEPLTFPYLLEICKYISDLSIDVFVYTSGNIIGKNNSIFSVSKDYFLNLKSAGVKEIVFSIHGSNFQIHDKITRTPQSFKNLLESINNAQTVGLKVSAHFVPIRENFRDLPSVVSVLKRLGLNSIHILRFVPQGRGYEYRSELTLLPGEVSELHDILKKLIDTSDITIIIGVHYNCLGFNGNKKCTAGIKKVIIRPDGFVFPCVGMKGVKNVFSSNNIRSDSLENIMNRFYGFAFLRANFYSCGNNSSNNCITECTNNDCIAQMLFKSTLDF